MGPGKVYFGRGNQDLQPFKEKSPKKTITTTPKKKKLLLIFLTNLNLKIGEGWAGVKFIPPPPEVPLEAYRGRSR